MISVAEPVLGPEEKAALARVIDSGWITMGERVQEFERAFATMHGAADAIAVTSATAGLHLAVDALGIGAGDEVLVPSLTFVASANCVTYVGAKPVFVDIESLSKPLMSLRDAASRCTSRTRAIVLVHYAGHVEDIEAWRTFAAKRNLRIIEDAAHAAGAPQAGTIGDAAVFSFYGNKNMTTAEGGMVIAADAGLRERMRQMRGHGLTSGTFQRHKSAVATYDVTMLGYNYRMDELRAALGLVQLEHLRSWNDRRRLLTQRYRQALRSEAADVIVPFADLNDSSFHILPVVIPPKIARQRLVERLRHDGIQTSVHYPAVHLTSLYRRLCPSTSLPVTEDFAARELTLPLHPRLQCEDVDRIVSCLAKSLSQVPAAQMA